MPGTKIQCKIQETPRNLKTTRGYTDQIARKMPCTFPLNRAVQNYVSRISFLRESQKLDAVGGTTIQADRLHRPFSLSSLYPLGHRWRKIER